MSLFNQNYLKINGFYKEKPTVNVATGIGFLCGDIIFRQNDYLVGLTTAAALWAITAGLAITFGMYVIGIMTTLLIFILLFLPRLPWWVKSSRKMKLYTNNKKD